MTRETIEVFWPWVAGIGLILLLLLVALAARRARRSAVSPPLPVPAPSAPPAPSAMPYLEHIRTSRRFPLKPEGVTIGRAPENDVVITEDLPEWETVSQRHAWVYRRGDRWVVEDLGSLNGIYVNGRRTGRNLLLNGWQLDIGGVELTFRANAEESR